MRLTINIKHIIMVALPMFIMNCGNLPAVKYHSSFFGNKLDKDIESKFNEVRKKVCQFNIEKSDFLTNSEILHKDFEVALYFYDDQKKYADLKNKDKLKKLLFEIGSDDIYDTFFNTSIVNADKFGMTIIQDNPSKEYKKEGIEDFKIKNPPLFAIINVSNGIVQIGKLYKTYGYKHVPYPKALDSDP